MIQSKEAYVVDGLRGRLWLCGLGEPPARFAASTLTVAPLSYLAGFPSWSFKRDGSIAPPSLLSTDPEAVPLYKHFFLLPLLAGTVCATCL